MARRAASLLAVIALAVVIGGFSDRSAPIPAFALLASPTAAAAIDLTLQDIKFDPTAITMPGETDVVFHLTNQGVTTHNFNIDALNVHSGDLEPGATRTLTIHAPAGTYPYYCSIPGHTAAGMVGTLTVLPPPPTATVPSLLATIQAKQNGTAATQAVFLGQTATAETQATQAAQVAGQTATAQANAEIANADAVATQNAELQTALAGLATSEAGAQQTASVAQTQLADANATNAAQAAEIAALRATETASATPTTTPVPTVTPTATETPSPTDTATPPATSTSTPMDTATPPATATSTPTATATPSPTPAPKAGQVLYQSGKTGFKTWGVSKPWNYVNGMLVTSSTQGAAAIDAPVALGGVSDYAVDADIQLPAGDCGAFGVFARRGDAGGYWAGFLCAGGASIIVADGPDQAGSGEGVLAKTTFAPGQDWHRYRLEVQGNAVRLFIDGTLMAQTTDTRFRSAGQVGLWTWYDQINVRSFKVIALGNGR